MSIESLIPYRRMKQNYIRIPIWLSLKITLLALFQNFENELLCLILDDIHSHLQLIQWTSISHMAMANGLYKLAFDKFYNTQKYLMKAVDSENFGMLSIVKFKQIRSVLMLTHY
ncbi:hypothetical protein FGO68_gene5506 [Halteria grandinella]|uniref:Uncharacterized protein n=1 Tax=Halteria grandinella TaxID=5974 RepID=A0A8J8NLD1_HALGN|nr:hypothetical protein FGO68_gene5506 [Halteria grandinella]